MMLHARVSTDIALKKALGPALLQEELLSLQAKIAAASRDVDGSSQISHVAPLQEKLRTKLK